MHIDLNACFAITEQQANPLLRGRPVGVTNRAGSEWATIIAPSYEAKRLGVRCGTRVDEARRLAPGIVILETDPPKYRYVHSVIKTIFNEYAPVVTMKSIDEGVLDFRSTTHLRAGKTLQDIGYEIKERVKEELGEWMTVNIGIGSNWFLAKLAASLNKPDCLDTIDANNLEGTYALSELTDLNGINRRFKARLMLAGITTPLEFLYASQQTLEKEVFRSINGRHWYLRLRGYEVDDVRTSMRHVGKQYVLHNRTNDKNELDQILYKLCYYISRRLRQSDNSARGMELAMRYAPRPDDDFVLPGWRTRSCWQAPIYGVSDLYRRAQYLFSQSPPDLTVSQFTLVSSHLQRRSFDQPALYETVVQSAQRVEQALQSVNDRYGELTMVPARMLGIEAYVPEKIAFGSTRYLLNEPTKLAP